MTEQEIERIKAKYNFDEDPIPVSLHMLGVTHMMKAYLGNTTEKQLIADYLIDHMWIIPRENKYLARLDETRIEPERFAKIMNLLPGVMDNCRDILIETQDSLNQIQDVKMFDIFEEGLNNIRKIYDNYNDILRHIHICMLEICLSAQNKDSLEVVGKGMQLIHNTENSTIDIWLEPEIDLIWTNSLIALFEKARIEYYRRIEKFEDLYDRSVN